VTLSYVELKMDAEAAHPSEAVLKAYFDGIKERFTEPERRHARHILIKAGANAQETLAKAQKVYAEVMQPNSDFAALAKKYSDDPGSAAQGGDLGVQQKSDFVGPFAEALFAMKAGEVKGPVKTEFGYHIIKLDEIQPGKTADFEKVRAQVESEYRKNESEKKFNDNQEKLERLAFEQSGSLNPLAEAIKVGITTVRDYHKGLNDNPVLSHPKVMDAAFSAEVLGGQNSRPIEIAPGDVVVLRVSDHRAPQVLALTEVHERVVKALQQEIAIKRQREAYEGIAAMVKTGGKSLDEIVASEGQTFPEFKGLKVSEAKLTSRRDTDVNAALKQAIFKMPAHVNTLAPLVTLDNQDAWVAELTSVRPGDPAVDASVWGPLLTRSYAGRDLEVYLARLRDRAKISFNRKALFE